MEAPLPDDDKDNEELYDRKVLIAAVVAAWITPLPPHSYFSLIFVATCRVDRRTRKDDRCTVTRALPPTVSAIT